MKNLINAPRGAKYLADFLGELPKGIFNKVETGCGMTSLALNNNDKYIVAVPFKHLVDNKMSQLSHVFGVDGKSDYMEFLRFLDRGGKKFITTYDSLPKLVRWLGKECFQDYKLLVDEYQVLLHQYTLRNTRFDDLIETASKFNHCTYGSATPLTPDFAPESLKGLPITEVVWPDTIKIKVARQRSSRPLATVKKLVTAYQSGAGVEYAGIKSTAGIFFINSVNTIANIIKTAELKPENVTVICGKTASNKETLGEFYDENVITTSSKPITFVTSCGWQGIDIYSDNALSYVVTLKDKSHTLMDINTAVIQAAGRVRNEDNPFKGQLVHIFNTDMRGRPRKKDGQTEDQYQEMLKEHYAKEDASFARWVQKRKDVSMLALSRYQSITQEELNDDVEFQIKNAVRDSEPYLQYRKVNGNWTVSFNPTFVLVDEWKYNSIQKTYRDGLTLRRAYAEAGFDITQKQEYDNPEERFEEEILSVTFNSAFKEYVSEGVTEERKETLASLYPLIKTAVDTLGEARCGTLKYVKKDIALELQKATGDVRRLIVRELANHYSSGTFVSKADLKNKLNEIYSKYETWRKVKAKATDIIDFFPDTEAARPTINGKRVEGFTIVYKSFSTRSIIYQQ